MNIADLPEFKRTDHLVTAAPGMSVREVVKLMSIARVGAVPVLDGKTVVGIFSERDIMTRVVDRDLDPKDIVIEEVMTPNPFMVEADCPLREALNIMMTRNFRHLPIKDSEGVMIGIVSSRDFLGKDLS